MRLLKLFAMIPTLPPGVWVVMLLAGALVAYGVFALQRRQIGRGLVFGGAGTLVLWGIATMLLHEEGPEPTTAQLAKNERIAAIVVGLCVAGGGAAAAAAGAGWLRSTWRFVRIAARTRGRIAEFTPSNFPGAKNVWLAIVEFRTDQGEQRRFETQYHGARHTAVGREVRVLYDPKDPSDAKIQSLSLWTMPLLVGAMGLVICAAGLALIFLKRE